MSIQISRQTSLDPYVPSIPSKNIHLRIKDDLTHERMMQIWKKKIFFVKLFKGKLL